MNSNKKRTFLIISVIYSGILLLSIFLFAVTKDAIQFERKDFLLFVFVYLITIGYFQILQFKIKKLEHPPMTSLAGIVLMGYLGVAIIGLLLFGIESIGLPVIAAILLTYLCATIWTGNKLWIKNNPS